MSTWGNVASAIAKSAPLLGNLLPGVGTVVGAGVGAAASIVASALGVSADPDSVYAALQSDPDALAKVRQAELDNSTALAQVAMQREQNQLAAESAQYASEVDDRKNARDRQTALHDSFPNWLAAAISLGFFTALVLLVIVPVPAENSSVVYLMLGSLGTAWTSVMAYIYGSTRQGVLQNAKVTDFAVSPGTVTVDKPNRIVAPTTASQPATDAPSGGGGS